MINSIIVTAPARDQRRLSAAIDMCRTSHLGQFERSGTPYFHKMLRFAGAIAAYTPPVDFVLAALLSDTIMDTTTTELDISSEFGKRTSQVVQTYNLIYDRNEDKQVSIRRKFLNPYPIYWQQRTQNFLTACFYVDGAVHRKLKVPELDLISPFKFIDDADAKNIRTIVDAPEGVQRAVSNMIGFVAQHNELLHQISPREFEILMAGLLFKQGYDIEITPMSGDGGVDIYAFKSDGVVVGRFAVECKRFSPNYSVGRPICQKLFGVVQSQNLTGGILITSSKFTGPALAFQEQASVCNKLSLVNALGVHRLLESVVSQVISP